MEKQRKKTTILLNDHMTAYLRFWSRIGFYYSRKALEFTEGKSEIVIPCNKWFKRDWAVNNKTHRRIRRKKLHRNAGTFHGFLEFHPTNGRFAIDYDNEDELERNITAMKSQIYLASKLGSMWRGTKMLIIHPGGSLRKTADEYIDVFVRALAPCLEYADKHKVQISIEPDLGTGKVKYYGNSEHIGNVVKMIERLTELAPKNNLKRPAGMTLDTSHTLLANHRDYDKVADAVREFGEFICYAHINHPYNYYISKNGLHPVNKKIGRLSGMRQVMTMLTKSQDGHNSIYRLKQQEKFNTILELLATRTQIPHYRRVLLEIGPRWDRGFNFWRAGSSGYGAYKSLKLLDSIFNKSV
ncbi:TIM barrel protein [Patescibacteria group bacterium]